MTPELHTLLQNGIKSVAAPLQAASKENLSKKGLQDSLVLCYESYKSSKNIGLIASVRVEVWALKLSSAPGHGGRLTQSK